MNKQIYCILWFIWYNYHIGTTPDYRSVEVAKNHHIDISKQQARQFRVDDFDTFNYIFVMDSSNYDNVVKLARTTEDLRKVKLILEADATISNKAVPDPYYGELSDFEYVYKLLNSACDRLVKQLQ